MAAPVVIAAGGTGGHLFPAAALAAELVARGRLVHLLTDSRADAFADGMRDVAIHRVRAGSFAGGPLRAAHGLAELAAGTVQARRLLRRLAPHAVVGFGGYPSVPTMLAASSLGLPTLLHEQNAVLGRANRMLAPRAWRIATGFPETALLRPAERSRAVHCGNPVRPAVLALGEPGYRPPVAGGSVELVVIGGSQGARILSEIVPPALAVLPPEWRAGLRVSHQARPEDLADVTGAYALAGIAAEIASFFADVPQRLARAQLVICRAGASTIAELAALGRPALLIPYPYATDDHQTANARAFAKAGGGWMVAQAGLRPESLAARLASLFADGPALAAAAERARAFGRRDAARSLALLTLALDPGVTGTGRAA
ncbi:MAG TPA: undecaprenyldiphospho-muramoylpentapeptide beta-N-acetylglucosaminyltransferase [Stellaceae bacterium]|nr:undecaprenyldiphospho-muramoylpentapeptide beta-N-acetylglucosaminyltransferase [Stellaceae bacterium]